MVVELIFQLFEGGFVGVFPAKSSLNYLDRGADTVERLEAQNLVVLDRRDAFIGIFVEQGFEHQPRLLAILREVVALLHILGAFAAGKRRGIVGNVGNEIEVAKVFSDFLGEIVEDNAVLL